MDNETMTPEVETVETAEEDFSVFDDAWGDGPENADNAENDSDSLEEVAPDAQPETTETTETTEQPENTATEEAPATADRQPQETQGSEGNQLFDLTFLGETKQYTREQVTEYAQKGLNYDHVNEERQTLHNENDRLKGENGKLQEYSDFVQELAKASNVTVDELIESTKARILISNAKLEGREMNEAEARRQVREAVKAEKAKKEEAEKAATKEQEQQPAPAETKKAETADPNKEKQDAEIARFAALYPELDPKTIPNSVWETFSKTGDLVAPYQKYAMEQLKAENEQLKQNAINKQRSTGSRATAGAAAPTDAFDEGWDS